MKIRPATPADIPAMRRLAAQADTAGQWSEAQYASLFQPGVRRLVLVIGQPVVEGFLVAEGEPGIIPIDFSFCGFGHYLFDISVCLAGGLKASLTPAFLEGYRSVRPLPEEDFRAVEAYALSGRLSYYAYQVDNPVERKWLQRRIPEVAQNQVARFLRRERILFDL